MTEHPDPVTARLLAEDPAAMAAYEALRPRYAFISSIIAARGERGWSQQALATRLGTTQSAIARLESGNQDPRLSTIVAVCEVLDLPFAIEVNRESADRTHSSS